MPIQVDRISHTYEAGLPGESVALSDVSFFVEDKKTVAIIGHTGSGKSTLLQHLNGLLKPDSGRIVIDGVDITGPGVSMVKVRRQVGMVFQYPEYQLFEETVAKDVAFGPKNLGLSEAEIERRVRTAIEMVGLCYEEVAERSPFQLSGGQKRRVAIAGVIAMEPKVLILDEPTAGLDPRAHGDILRMIEDVHRKTENITIFVSHNMADVARLADQVIVIDNGRVLIDGTPQTVFGEQALLEGAGLALPPVTRFTESLRAKGFPLSKTILTAEQAAAELGAYLKGRVPQPAKAEAGPEETTQPPEKAEAGPKEATEPAAKAEAGSEEATEPAVKPEAGPKEQPQPAAKPGAGSKEPPQPKKTGDSLKKQPQQPAKTEAGQENATQQPEKNGAGSKEQPKPAERGAGR